MKRVTGLLVIAAMAATCLTACEKVNAVSSSVSPCFRVLPLAHAAIGDQGKFVDVARVRGPVFPRLPRLRPRRSAPTLVPTTNVTGQPDSCVVAFKGTFDPSRMEKLIGTARSGTYAVVIVSVRTQQVRACVLTETLPSPLHAH